MVSEIVEATTAISTTDQSGHFFLDVTNQVTENVFSERGSVNSKLTRIDTKTFVLVRKIELRDFDISNVKNVFMQIVLGGEGISATKDSISYGNCTLNLQFDEDSFSNYYDQAKVLSVGKRVNNANEITFQIRFTLNCG